jgi:hypothetical protein
MAIDRRAGGHAFDFSTDVCAKCAMTRPYYEDNGHPNCAGQAPKARDEPMYIETDMPDE